MITSRSACEDLDRSDSLAFARDRFCLPEGVIYLDGNSLGPLPKETAGRLARTIEQEWGAGLIRSWNDAGWIDLPRRIGGKIARLIGAQATANPTLLAFTPGNWNIPQDVTVTAVDDLVAEPPHTGQITQAAVSSDPDYNGIPVDGVTAHITDNDLSLIHISEPTRPY